MEAGVLINWTHGVSDLLAVPWTNPASDSSEQCCISFPAVHQTDRETLSPDLSTSISNTILIPSGSKEAASFASLSLGRNRSTLPLLQDWTTRFDQSIAVRELWPKCPCSNDSPLKNGGSTEEKHTRTNFHQNSPWSGNESNYTVLCYALFQQKIFCLTSTASVLKSHRSKHESLDAGERTEWGSARLTEWLSTTGLLSDFSIVVHWWNVIFLITS